MPEVIDLSNLKKERPAPDQGEDLPKQQMRTAFLVIQDLKGGWQATPDLSVADIMETTHIPTGDDLIAGMNIILSHLQAEKAANMTAVMMQQLAAQQMQAMQNQQIAANLHL